MPDPIQSSSGFPAENRDGSPALIGPDDYTRQLRRQFADKVAGQDVVVGNLADLHRLGADAAQSNSSNKAFATGEGVDLKDSNTISPAQQEAARGEWTRETQRTGLLDAPIPPVPAINNDPTPVDPGAQSPTTVKKGATK